ncbi:MAG: YlxR family protein [Ruminococcaceae bacterium]|nr:YlxR family protein [Oscillospiraceae bacterium]
MEQKKKKIPERQCLGCGEHRPKIELLRVVRDPEGQVSLDFTGKKSGRGAYICKKLACLKLARRKRSLSRNLACEIPDDVYTALEEQFHAGE